MFSRANNRVAFRSKIEKLGVRGIRSFGPTNAQFVTFNTPLTLIVGENGSGKTTIIECLKYATTGEQPPNSKGGAFLHDPKLAGESVIKAQVKLSFYSTIGQQLVVTRSLQVTQAKKKLNVKTIDGTLRVETNGEHVSLSKKNAELDEMVPEKMGVPAAILENVIFCHQDDSLWPLSEPSVLKKKFDELFEAIKYTKAIDNLKLLRKKHGEQLRIFKNLEETSKQDKEKGERYGKAIKVLEAEIAELEKKYKTTLDKMDKYRKEEATKRQEANSFFGIVTDLQNKKVLYEERKQMADELLETIERMSDSEEELEAALSQYADKVKQMKDDATGKTAKYTELKGDLGALRKSLQDKLADRGKHVADKEHHDRQVSARLSMVKEAAQQHGIRGFDGDLTEAQVKSFENRVQKLLDEKKREVAVYDQELEKLKTSHGKAVADLTARRESLNRARDSAQKRISDIDLRLKGLQRSVGDLHVDDGAKAVLDSNSTQLETELREAYNALQQSELDDEINEANDNLGRLQGEASRLNNELVQCTHLASERAQLDLRRKEAENQNVYLKSVMATWGDKLAALAGGPVEPETIGKVYQQILDQQSAAVSAKKSLVDEAQQEIRQLDYKVSSAREEVTKTTKDTERAEKAVCDALMQSKDEDDDVHPVHTYLDRLASLQESLSVAETDLHLFDALAEYYEKAKKKMERDNKCTLCERSFGDSDKFFKSKLVQKIVKNLDQTQKEVVNADIQRLRKQVDILRAVRTNYDTYQRTKAQLPPLEEKLQDLESEKEAMIRKQETLDKEMSALEDKRLDTESMGKAVRSITDAVAKIADSEKQIERLASQQSSSGNIRSAHEIQEAQVKNSEQTRALSLQLNKLVADRQRKKDLISQLELNKSELQRKLSEFNQKVERKNDLIKQIESLKTERDQMQETKDEGAKELEDLEQNLFKAESIRDEEVGRAREKLQKATEQKNLVAETVGKLKSLSSDIQDYLDRGGPGLAAANDRTIKNLEQSLERMESDITKLTAEINNLRQEADNSDRKKKNIQDNLAYNRTLRIVDKLEKEIEALEDRNAQEDWERLDGEANMLKMKFDDLSGKSHVLKGTLETKKAEQASRVAEYQQDYSDARLKFREAHIKVETTKAAIEDMGSYSAALEKAIMSYHSLKMEEVNRIADELWRSTYQGTDIDTILIRSEVETSATASTTRRTYNYRLCMVKQDTEMDMRGRCSAGQKVLASIIIRLALAESFGVSCGLIALDEPTTNLDEANIRSLAVSLHNIIQARQAQSNFQLIVITHDEAFLRAMQCSDFCDTFYRVRRDEMQRSTISRENISVLMD
ncbi:hypothetical protein MCOR07_011438 [Pyricularia oryzae]|nr:hypothetical protein MCOR19_011168 [Pyricularia oryzae]KAI6307551.1 hypothetical protein MCOR29_009646 [Pyricularia oryzae]KAI6455622.1 hypothetical protein MCOR17_008604 [Pyricularia oryzae]KAI6578426.1 hypothetical protein MCOR04_006424 [Pyricularia oryzae]KAI6609452.1 hypothetical protein MCOR07_011438 [Pyricularia oryzae]